MTTLAKLNKLRLAALEKVKSSKSEAEAKLAGVAVFCFLEAMEIVADAEAQTRKKAKRQAN